MIGSNSGYLGFWVRVFRFFDLALAWPRTTKTFGLRFQLPRPEVLGPALGKDSRTVIVFLESGCHAPDPLPIVVARSGAAKSCAVLDSVHRTPEFAQELLRSLLRV